MTNLVLLCLPTELLYMSWFFYSQNGKALAEAASVDRILAAIEPLAQRVTNLEHSGNKQRVRDKDTGYAADEDTLSSYSEEEIFFDDEQDTPPALPVAPTPSIFGDGERPQGQEQQQLKDILEESYADNSGEDLVTKPIFEPIAKYLGAWLKNKPKSKDYFDLLKAVPYPENVPALAECQINPEVFYQLNMSGKQADKRNKVLINGLLKGIRPLATILHNVIDFESQIVKDKNNHRVLKQGKAELDLTELRLDLDKSVKILSATYSLLSYQRKAKLRHYLQGTYAQLCSPSVPITSQLFGDNINETVKNITNMNRIGKSMRRPMYRSQNRYQPFDRRSKNFQPRQGSRGQSRQFYRQRLARRGSASPRFRGNRRGGAFNKPRPQV